MNPFKLLLFSTLAAIQMAPSVLVAKKATYPCVASECYYGRKSDHCLCRVELSSKSSQNYVVYKKGGTGSCLYENLCTQGMKMCPDRALYPEALSEAGDGDHCIPPKPVDTELTSKS